MNTVFVIEHGSDPRPARVLKYLRFGRDYVSVEFTDERNGQRLCMASSVFPTKAEAVRAEKEMEASVDNLSRPPHRTNSKISERLLG